MNIKALKEQYATLITEGKNLVEGGLKGEGEKEKFASINKQATELKATIDQATAFAKLAVENNSADEVEVKETFAGKKDSKASFTNWAQTGERFTITTSNLGGVLVPKEVGSLISVRQQQNALRRALADAGISPIYSSNIVQRTIPLFNDVVNEGQVQPEDARVGTELDPTSAGITLNPVLYSSKQIWISNTDLLAPGFDISGEIVNVLEKRLDKKQEKDWMALLAAGTIGVTTASNSAISYGEFLDWQASIDLAYADDAVLFASKNLYRLLRGMVDANGRPILDTDPTTKVTTLGDLPIYQTKYIAGGANAVAGVIASVSALKVYDAGVERAVRYVEDPQYPDQVGFEIFKNGAFGFDPNGVSVLKMHV